MLLCWNMGAENFEFYKGFLKFMGYLKNNIGLSVLIWIHFDAENVISSFFLKKLFNFDLSSAHRYRLLSLSSAFTVVCTPHSHGEG